VDQQQGHRLAAAIEAARGENLGVGVAEVEGRRDLAEGCAGSTSSISG
jgi:hypothetical protein